MVGKRIEKFGELIGFLVALLVFGTIIFFIFLRHTNGVSYWHVFTIVLVLFLIYVTSKLIKWKK